MTLRAPSLAAPVAPVVTVSIAYVKFPNTPDSDRQLRVMHVVELSDGTKVELMATDPMNAIDLVRARRLRP